MQQSELLNTATSILSDVKKQELTAQTQTGRKTPVSGNKGLAITSNPLVSQIAIDVLKDGGNAVDAIIAAAVTQNIVEPTQSSLAGMFGMLYFEASTGKISYLNAGFNAPRKLPVNQNEWNSNAATYLRDGRSVVVPGFWAGVEEALHTYGSLSKKRLFAPAIDFARNGVEVNQYLYGFIYAQLESIGISEQGREIYMPNGRAIINQGEMLYQKRAADLLERLVQEGNNYYYHGGFAEKVCKAAQKHQGWVSMEDFANYQARWDNPVHTTYHDYSFYGSPAPDFGGQALAEIFNMLEQLDLPKMGPAALSAETTWRMKQIIRLVDQENSNWNCSHNKPDLDYILSKELAAKRLEGLPDIGLPKRQEGRSGSCHLTVADATGNVATLFHTSACAFLNGIFVDGIQIPPGGSAYYFGIPKNGGRTNMRSCANMFLRNNKPVLVSGSNSGSAIEAVTQCTTSVLDFGLSLESAVHQPRFGGDFGVAIPEGFAIEADMPSEIFDFLRHKQVPFQKVNPYNVMNGCFEAIAFDENGTAHACSDPRRAGQSFAV